MPRSSSGSPRNASTSPTATSSSQALRVRASWRRNCQRIEITSTDAGTFATFVGLTDPTTGKEQRTGFADPNLRPQIVGIFTDLVGPAPPGLSASATIDTRFSTKPTLLKLAAMIGAIVATVIALIALWRLDRLDGRRMHSLIPARWRTFSAADVVVVGTFLLWHVAGANSSDDGYILGMARVADHAGYMSNYFRWFGSPEDPFGWYYNLLALMTHVSDASIWMRLPDLIAALVCWLLLSREVLPRLGPAVAASQAGAVGGGPGAARGLDAVQQRPAARGPDRRRRADHLRADRAGHHLRPDDARGAGRDRRRVHPRYSADRADRGCRSARGRSPAAADPCAQAPTSSAHGR